MTYLVHVFAIARFGMDLNVSNLRELQRFAEVGRISAGLIHDMSGPLTAAILHLEQDEPHSLSNIKHARRNIRLLERYIETVRRHLQHSEEITSSFNIKKEIAHVKHVLRPLALKQAVRVEFRIYSNCLLYGDPIKFQRIITNLATNSIDAYSGDNALSPRIVRITVTTKRQALIVRVRDWGKGISPEQIPKLFEPFYTTKAPGSLGGTGIGLYNVKRYIEEDFNGIITVISTSDQGTEFRVECPLNKAS